LRNFGMSRPRAIARLCALMKLAEKFGLPVFTFVDTPGAYPRHRCGRARGQSEAIGRNIFEMAQLEVADHRDHHRRRRAPAGALAISVVDQLLMLCSTRSTR